MGMSWLSGWWGGLVTGVAITVVVYTFLVLWLGSLLDERNR